MADTFTKAQFAAYVASENAPDDVSAAIQRAVEIVGKESATENEWSDAISQAFEENI